MRVAIYDRVEPSTPASLPLRLTQACSQRSASVFLALALPATIAVTAAILFVAFEAVAAPAAHSLLRQRPAIAIELLVAVSFLFYVLVLPTRRQIYRLAARREIYIAQGIVTVAEFGHFRSWTWSEPLASYRGVAHHVRASLSGTRHEIILVHAQRQKSVLLCVAPKTSQADVENIATLLGHREIPSSELYRFKGLWPRVATEPLPEAAHA